MSSIITFYSYKGGVGRSMTMANIAVLMAQRGLKVLAVDWDLEAPGLERYFSYFDQSSRPGGLLPFFTEVAGKLGESENVPQYQNHIWDIKVSEKHSFALIPSGRETHQDYAALLEEFNWHDFFAKGGGDFLEQLRTQWLASYDFVLIDSRTGMSDAGGICTIQMPDVLVAMFTANDQSMRGVLDVIQAAQRGRQHLAYDRMPLTILPVVSRFSSQTEFQESSIWLDRLAEHFSGICDDWLMPWISLRNMFELLKIPQVDWFGFGERLAVVEQGTSSPGGIGFAIDRITDLLASDFKNLEAALGNIANKPAGWEKPERAKIAQGKIKENEDYEFDLYISYKHGGVLDEWVRSFREELIDWLSIELPDPKVFLDVLSITSGTNWESSLQNAVKRSKILIAILTPAYFASDFCMREWAYFAKRERLTKSGPLIFPVLLRGGELMPFSVRSRQWLDASNVDLVSNKSSRKVSRADYTLLEAAASSIAKMLESVPPYDPNLNIVLDTKELEEFRSARPKPFPPRLG